MIDDLHAYLTQRAGWLIHALTQAFVGHVGGGMLSASAYETAWVARVPHPAIPAALAFPDSLDWLLRRQHADGSWGPAYPHALLATLAALVALRAAPVAGIWVREGIGRADTYLRQTLPTWDAAAADTPFIEFLAPALLGELAQLGLRYDVTFAQALTQQAQAKVGYFPFGTLYAGTSPLVHALEALDPHIDYQRLQQPAFGGYGYSPSATAAVLLRGRWDARAAEWLHSLSEQRLDGLLGGMPSSHPSDVFETAWVVSYLQRGKLVTPQQTRPLVQWLQTAMTPVGVSFSRVPALPPDVDDTAMALTVVARGGERMDPAPLWHFAADDHFVSYAHERTTSTSANAHALEALAYAPLTDGKAAHWRTQVRAYLLNQQQRGAWWQDKWHISRYYATDCCVQALVATQTPESVVPLRATWDWLIGTQRADGGWGEGESTIEETAYALLTLHALGARGTAPQRGGAYLWRYRRPWRFDSATLPQFWVDKSLYAPPRVIEAAALAALHLTLREGMP